MDEILDALAWRYAVKKFDAARKLSLEQIQLLKQAFNLTPTSYGLQPITLLVLQNAQVQEQLLPYTYNQRQVVDASHLLVLCIEKKIDAAYIEAYFERVKAERGTPDDILNPFKASLIQRFSGMSDEAFTAWATNQAYLALGNLITVCAQARIDACPMEGFDPNGYRDILNLEAQGLYPAVLLPVGYRAEDDRFAAFKKVRKDVAEAVKAID